MLLGISGGNKRTARHVSVRDAHPGASALRIRSTLDQVRITLVWELPSVRPIERWRVHRDID
jgi:hypothetical protein